MSTQKETRNIIKNGEIAINFRFDIGKSISDLAAAATVLGIQNSQRQEIKPRKRRESESTNFINPPIFTKINCTSFEFENIKTEQVALLLAYSNGCIEIEFSITLSERNYDLNFLEKLVTALSLDEGRLEREARRLASETVTKLAGIVSEPRDPNISEDFIAIFIEEFVEEVTGEMLLKNCSDQLARIIEQEYGVELSSNHTKNVISNQLSYGKKELIILGFNVGLFYGSEIKDEANLVDVVNLHRLELRLLLQQLENEHDELKKLFLVALENHAIGKGNLKSLDKISLRIFDLIVRSERVSNAISDPLPLTADPFLAQIYNLAAKTFGVYSLLHTVEKRISKLEKLQQSLNQTREHQTSKRLELTVIWLIVLEVIPTVLKWIFGIAVLVFGAGWLAKLGGYTLEKFIEVFLH